MNTEKLIVYGGLGYLAYLAFFKDKQPTSNTALDLGQPILEEENNVGKDGKYHFRYVGMSALRTDPITGKAINCGVSNEPFSSTGVEGRFASTGVAPTTYYAMLELGSEHSIMEKYTLPNSNLSNGQHRINVGDRLGIKLLGGQFSALENQMVTVLQVGSDTCTSSGQAEMMNSAIVVDIPIVLEGAGDSQYPPQQAVGYVEII